MTTLRKYAKLITDMARVDAGSKRVRVDAGVKVWWLKADKTAHGNDLFRPEFTYSDAYESDLSDCWRGDLWKSEKIPASGTFTVDFYIHVPAWTFGDDWELDTNVVVTFVDGKPTRANCTGGRAFTIDADAMTFTQTSAPRRY
jgi:hypothetical protein